MTLSELGGRGSSRLLLSRIAVTILALVALYDCLDTIGRWFSTAGFIGITIDGATAIVVQVDPFNGTTGIKVGDVVDVAAMPFRERSYLYEGLESIVQRAGLRMTVPRRRSAISLIRHRSFGLGYLTNRTLVFVIERAPTVGLSATPHI